MKWARAKGRYGGGNVCNWTDRRARQTVVGRLWAVAFRTRRWLPLGPSGDDKGERRREGEKERESDKDHCV